MSEGVECLSIADACGVVVIRIFDQAEPRNVGSGFPLADRLSVVDIFKSDEAAEMVPRTDNLIYFHQGDVIVHKSRLDW